MNHMINLKARINIESDLYETYLSCVEDLLQDEKVHSMQHFVQHGEVSCLDHCLEVSVMSFKLSKVLGMDYKSAARGALLHDFFLYDWHVPGASEGLHGFTHARAALKNANQRFDLNEVEQDIIKKHMWPLNIQPPKYRESMVVTLVDKLCALREISLVKRIAGFVSVVKVG